MQLQYTTNFSNAKTQNRTKSPCFFPLKGLKTPTKAPISDALPLPNAHECVPNNQHLFVSWRAFWCKTACLDAENGGQGCVFETIEMLWLRRCVMPSWEKQLVANREKACYWQREGLSLLVFKMSACWLYWNTCRRRNTYSGNRRLPR